MAKQKDRKRFTKDQTVHNLLKPFNSNEELGAAGEEKTLKSKWRRAKQSLPCFAMVSAVKFSEGWAGYPVTW